MAMRGGSGAYRKGRRGSMGFDVSYEGPDFKNATISRRALKVASAAAAEYLLVVIRPQIPFKTGQLRASYRLNRTTMFLGPADTRRSDSSLKNYDLANILHQRGYLRIQLSEGHIRYATRLARDALVKEELIEFRTGRIRLE